MNDLKARFDFMVEEAHFVKEVSQVKSDVVVGDVIVVD